MEVAVVSLALGLLLLPLLAVWLMALCVRCQELPDPYDGGGPDSSTPSSIMIKPPTIAPWPSTTFYPSVTSYPPLSQPDLLPIPRSPQPPVGAHRMPCAWQNSAGPNYENDEPACEDEDEDDDEEDNNHEGYLVVLPDTAPATVTAVPPAPVPSNLGLRDTFSMESGEDYVNVPDCEESADASLDGSREYVNVPEELQPTARTEPATLSSQEEEEEEEEVAPDYENL